jgi:hypothetical protein
MHGFASPRIGKGRWAALAVMVPVAVLACGAANAQQASWNVNPGLTDQWTLQLGAFQPHVDTTAHLNSSTGARGTEFTFEDTLGMADSKTIPTFLASVRLGQNWKIEGEYFELKRSATRTLNRTINWGDQTFPVSASVSSEFDSNIYRLSAGYSFIKDNQKELGAVLGFHVTDFKASLAAPTFGAQSGNALAPLPTIGAYGAYAFNPRWLLSGRADYFSLNYNQYNGKLLNFSAGVEYRFVRNFGASLAWRRIDYELTATKSNFNGGLEYKFSGPMLSLVGSF